MLFSREMIGSFDLQKKKCDGLSFIAEDNAPVETPGNISALICIK